MITNINLRFKKRTTGTESKLISNFLSLYQRNNSSLNDMFTIFSEPFIESGFPDVVIAIWDKNKLQKWHPERANFDSIDLKILHHIVVNNTVYTNKILQEQLGYSFKQIEKSLEKFVISHLIKYYKNDSFRVLSVKNAFFIKSIIAIEAKIKDWKNAFIQAETNLWFASESYVLLPDYVINSNVINYAETSPVGLLSFNNDNYDVLLKSEKRKMPVSYCSWLFNENVGKNPNVKNGFINGSI